MKLAVRAFAALAAAGLALPALAESVSFSADSVQSSLAKGKEMTILSGRASVKTGVFDEIMVSLATRTEGSI